MINVFAYLLLLIGSGLEVLYYVYRFSQDGTGIIVSFIIGTGLTILLIVATYFKDKFKIVSLLLILSVGSYSVLATSAGQLFSLMTKENKSIQTVSQDSLSREKIKEYQADIIKLTAKWDKLESVINNSISSLDDSYTWKNTLAKAQKEQKEIDTNIAILRKNINDLRDKLTTSETIAKKETNIYKLYASLFNFSEVWVQFVFQTILSVFIAIMAPFAIVILKDNKAKNVIKKDTHKDKWIKYIERFVSISWIAIRKGSADYLLPKDKFLLYLKNKNELFPEYKYDLIIRAAKKANVIIKKADKLYPIVEKEIDAIKLIHKHLNKNIVDNVH
ncbi:MAG: hypothetical protein OEV44_13835 [Spirochaetota bacterium]|nr:hypothetical protein [Spirochaetota bacterium]